MRISITFTFKRAACISGLYFISCLLCLLLVFVDIRTVSPSMELLLRNPSTYLVFKIICLGGGLACWATGVFALSYYISGKELLTVDHKGIFGNGSMLSYGLIPWSDVESLYLVDWRKKTYIMADVADFKKYFEDMPWWKSSLMKIIHPVNYNRVRILCNKTDKTPEQLLGNMTEFWKAQRE